MLSVHGDNKGLVIPPKLARIQVIIIPIYNNDAKELVIKSANDLSKKLSAKARVFVDDNDSYSPGWKFHEWELRGVPIRIEIGERDIKADKVVVYRRDTGKKQDVKIGDLTKEIESLLEEIHQNLYNNALKQLKSNIHQVHDYSELKKIITGTGGFAEAPWCGSSKCEEKVKSDTKGKISNMPLDIQEKAKGKKCIVCGEEAKHMANFAKSY